jgi:hypothetical protein
MPAAVGKLDESRARIPQTLPMSSDEMGETDASEQTRWLWFGVALTVVYAAYTILILALLRVDQSITLIVVVGGSAVFGLAIMIYVLYFR